jgi:hypothetical protein
VLSGASTAIAMLHLVCWSVAELRVGLTSLEQQNGGMPNLSNKPSSSSFTGSPCALSRGRAAVIVPLLAALILAANSPSVARSQRTGKPPRTQEPAGKEDSSKIPNEKALEKAKKQEETKPAAVKLTPAEGVVELAILAYGGRKQLETVRAAIQEAGSIRLATDQGDLSGNYLLRSVRKDKSWQDLLRVDLELSAPETAQTQSTPPIKYVIGFNGASVWSAQNGQYVNPRSGADVAFRGQLTHEYMALLRYKEDGSKLEYVGPETVVGVDSNVIDLATPDGEKTRYWLSTKTYRILHCEYELKLVEGQPATKYRIDYYYTPNSSAVVQNTLVPVRREMKQDGKFVQEIKLISITYSAKLEPEVFQHLQEQ